MTDISRFKDKKVRELYVFANMAHTPETIFKALDRLTDMLDGDNEITTKDAAFVVSAITTNLENALCVNCQTPIGRW